MLHPCEIGLGGIGKQVMVTFFVHSKEREEMGRVYTQFWSHDGQIGV